MSGRLIDVSRRGAQLLGFQKQGVTRVRIQASDERGRVARGSSRRQVARAPQQPVRRESQQSSNTAAGAETHFVQIGSFSSQENAAIQANQLRKSGHPARVQRQVQNGRTFWRVRIGPFIERLLAQDRLDRVVADGFMTHEFLLRRRVKQFFQGFTQRVNDEDVCSRN